MSLPGKVIEVHETYALVEVEPKPECKGCHACTGLLDGEKKSAHQQIKALIDEVRPEVGDEVIVDLNPGEGSLAALMVFGIPMAGFFGGLALTPWLCGIAGMDVTDGARFLWGMLTMALSFVLLALIARTGPVKKISLRVMEIRQKKSPV